VTPAEILRAYNAKNINLDALFGGGNPFGDGQNGDEEIEPIAGSF
jgi:hypothetical protein